MVVTEEEANQRKALTYSSTYNTRYFLVLVEKMESTLLPEPGDLSIPGSFAHGYGLLPGRRDEVIDLTRTDQSMAGAAGGGALVTTTADLARFFNALLDGELFRNLETLDEMLTFIDATSEYDTVWG